MSSFTKIIIGFVTVVLIAALCYGIYLAATWHQQPWEDDQGRWHNEYACHPYEVTDYTYIHVGTGKSSHTISVPTGHHTEEYCSYE